MNDDRDDDNLTFREAMRDVRRLRQGDKRPPAAPNAAAPDPAAAARHRIRRHAIQPRRPTGASAEAPHSPTAATTRRVQP